MAAMLQLWPTWLCVLALFLLIFAFVASVAYTLKQLVLLWRLVFSSEPRTNQLRDRGVHTVVGKNLAHNPANRR